MQGWEWLHVEGAEREGQARDNAADWIGRGYWGEVVVDVGESRAAARVTWACEREWGLCLGVGRTMDGREELGESEISSSECG